MIGTDRRSRARSTGATVESDGTEASSASPFAGLLFFAIFGLAIPLVVLTTLRVRGAPVNIVGAYAICAYAAGAISLLVWKGGGRIVRLGFLIFLYVFMGLAVFAQVSSNTFPLNLPGTGLYTTDEITLALVRVGLGIVAFELAYVFLSIRRASAPQRPVLVRPQPRQLSQVRILMVAAIGIVMTAYIVATVGIRPFFLSRQDAGNAIHGVGVGATQAVYEAANKASGGLTRYLSKVPILVALFGMLYLRHHKLWVRGNQLMEFSAHVTLGLLIVANVIINNPLSNSRFWFSTVAITLASAYLPLHRNRGIRIAAFGAIGTLIFAFTSLQAFRRTGGARSYSAGFLGDLTTSGTYSAFTLDMVGGRWLSLHDHTFGGQLIGSIFVFVPRSWWPAKPVDTGNLILPITNPAANMWTEGNVEFGLAGIVVVFVILGLLAALLDARFIGSVPGMFTHAAVPVVGGVLIFFLRGSLYAAIAPAYVLALMFFLMTRKQPPEAPTSRRRRSSRPAEALVGPP